MSTVLVVRPPGTARAPARVAKRLRRNAAAPDQLAVDAKLATAAALKEARLNATVNAQEQHAAKLEAAKERREALLQAQAAKLLRKEESAKERAAEALKNKTFTATNDLQKVKDARRRLNAETEAKAASLAASLESAEQRSKAALEARAAKAAVINERHERVVSRVREQTAAERDTLAAKIDSKLADAASNRFQHTAWTVTKNVAHGLYAEQVVSRHGKYERSLAQYKDVSSRCELELAEHRRMMHLATVRARATETVDRARLTVQHAKQRAAAAVHVARKGLESKLKSADLRARLLRAGAMEPGDRLSSCGAFIIAADGAWRDVPAPGELPPSRARTPSPAASPTGKATHRRAASDGEEESWVAVSAALA